MSGSIWNPASSASSDVSSQRFVATAGQTVFNLSAFSYTPNINSLLVYVNGLYKQSGIDYTETSSTSITFLAGLNIGDKVTIVGLIAIVGAGLPGFLSPTGSILVTGATAGPTGTGVLIEYGAIANTGQIICFDFTNSLYKNLDIDGLVVNINNFSLGDTNIGGALNVNKNLTVIDANNHDIISISPTNALFVNTALSITATRAASPLFDFVNFKANGVSQFRVKGDGTLVVVNDATFAATITVAGVVFTSAGNIATPGLNIGSTGDGFYKIAAHHVGYSVNGVQILDLTAGGLEVTGGFGCNSSAPQTPVASGGAMAAYVTGAFGLDSDVHMTAMYNLVKQIRVALVANGIMS